MTKRNFIPLIFGLLVVLSLPVMSALAQGTQPPTDNTGWGNFFDTNGNPLPGVQDAGVVYQDVNWMPQFPSWTGINLQAEYHQYVAPNGATMLMPTMTTYIMSHFSGGAATMYQADAVIGNAGTWQLDMSYATGNVVTDLWNMVTGYTTPDSFMDVSMSGTFMAWSFLWPGNDTWNIFSQMYAQSVNDGSLYTTALLFNSCAASPVGCPPDILAALTATPVSTETTVPDDPAVTPPPPASCPGISVSQAAPSMSIAPGDPPYPVVVGQDPDRRGADVTGHITLPPVIVTWYEPRYEEDWGCVGPKFPGDAPCVRGRRQVVTYLAECIAHHEAVPEQIAGITATATLSEASRSWIIGDLGSRWYGAYIHRGSFNLLSFGNSGASCGADGTCRAVIDAHGVPFADPGYFDLLLRVSTNGAFWNGYRVTAPRSLSVNGRLGVSVILPTLIDASTMP